VIQTEAGSCDGVAWVDLEVEGHFLSTERDPPDGCQCWRGIHEAISGCGSRYGVIFKFREFICWKCSVSKIKLCEGVCKVHTHPTK